VSCRFTDFTGKLLAKEEQVKVYLQDLDGRDAVELVVTIRGFAHMSGLWLLMKSGKWLTQFYSP